MGKIGLFLRRLLFILITVSFVLLTITRIIQVELDVIGTMHITDSYVNPYYEMLSDNVGLTNINGISNVYINMCKDGYDIYNEEITDSTIDVIFVKDGYPTYRYYYVHSTGKITFFSSQYEDSYIGLSYINEEKK